MVWLPPKLDWTADDFLNYEDLNRVENNIETIAEVMIALGHQVSLGTVVKDRNIKRIEFANSLNRIENNINILGQRYKPPGWQEPKLDWQANISFSYIDILRMEGNLALLYAHYKGNLDSIPYCGVYFCGEEAV